MYNSLFKPLVSQQWCTWSFTCIDLGSGFHQIVTFGGHYMQFSLARAEVHLCLAWTYFFWDEICLNQSSLSSKTTSNRSYQLLWLRNIVVYWLLLQVDTDVISDNGEQFLWLNTVPDLVPLISGALISKKGLLMYKLKDFSDRFQINSVPIGCQ